MTSSLLHRVRVGIRDPRLARILRDAGMTTGAAAVGAVLGIVRNALLARGLGVEGYGRLAVIVSSAALVRQVLSVRAWEWATVELSRALVAKDGARAGAVLRATWSVGAVVSGTAAVVTVLLSQVLATRLLRSPELTGTLQLYALVLLTGALDDGSLASLRVCGRHRFVAVYTVGAALTRVLILVPALLVEQSLRAVVLATLAGQLVPNVFVAIAARRALAAAVGSLDQGSAWLLLKEWRSHGSMLATLSLSDTVKTLTSETDSLVVASMQAPAAVAPYRAAYNIASGVLQLATPLYMVFYPEMTKAAAAGDGAGVRRLIRQISLIGGGVAAFASVGLLVGAPVVVRWLYGPGFEEAALDLRLMAPWTAILAVQWANPLFTSARAPRYTTYMVVAGLVGKTLALVAFVPEHSHRGAAGAWIAYALCIVTAALLLRPRALAALERHTTAPRGGAAA